MASSVVPANVIVFDNSTGTADHFDWPSTFASLRPDLTVVNRSVGGAELETHIVLPDVGLVQGLIDNFATWILPYKSATLRNILLLREMNNRFVYNFDDGFGNSYGHGFTDGAEVYTVVNGVATAIALAAANGIDTFIVTPINWADADYVQAEVERGLGQLSTACLANTGGASGVLNLRATTPTFDPVLDPQGYFIGDGIHPSALGATQIATRIAAMSAGVF